jgi:hypothetical protein
MLWMRAAPRRVRDPCEQYVGRNARPRLHRVEDEQGVVAADVRVRLEQLIAQLAAGLHVRRREDDRVVPAPRDPVTLLYLGPRA